MINFRQILRNLSISDSASILQFLDRSRVIPKSRILDSFFIFIITSFPGALPAQSSQISFGSDHSLDNTTAEPGRLSKYIDQRSSMAGLASGISELNKTVDSLMEDIFYSVMDRQLTSSVTDEAGLTTFYKREVQPAGLGNYVVVDRFSIGPDFSKNIGLLGNLPFSLNGSGKIFITNAQRRSDAQRKIENRENSFWSAAFKNWFGLIPFLTWALPPSFNPEELYDPIKFLQTPFLFPATATEAILLPIGTVRSYGIAGSSSISALLDDAGVQRAIEEATRFNSSAPLSSHIQRENKISILRRSESEVWLAISDSRKISLDMNLNIIQKFRSLSKVTQWWKGIGIPIIPINFKAERGSIISQDELFSFDLSNPSSIKAFEKALRGDLTLARSSASPQSYKSLGIHQHFKRTRTRSESQEDRENSFYIIQNTSSDSIGSGEVKIEDKTKSSFNLEADLTVENRDWNLLVGEENKRYTSRLVIPVIKTVTSSGLEAFDFDTQQIGSSYRKITSSIRIIDNFVDTQEYFEYIRELKKFTGLTLDGTPFIPEIPSDMRNSFIAKAALINPSNRILSKGLAPPLLGKLEVFAELYFSWEVIKQISEKSKSEVWRALAQAFRIKEEKWVRAGLDKNFSYYGDIVSDYLLFPLRVLNLNLPSYSHEGSRIDSALSKIRRASAPKDMIDSYYELFDTKNPAELTQTLGSLAKDLPLPVLVSFKAQTSNGPNDSSELKELKKNFEELNGKIFQSRWPIPELVTDPSPDEKMKQFSTGEYLQEETEIAIVEAKLELELAEEKSLDKDSLTFEFSIEMDPNSNTPPEKAYIRLVSFSPLEVGKVLLGEEVFSLQNNLISEEPLTKSKVIRKYRLSLLSSTQRNPRLTRKALGDGDFDLYVSLTKRETLWSPEKHFSFRIERGVLLK